MKRLRHLPIVWGPTPSRAATTALLGSRSLASTIFTRNVSAAGNERDRVMANRCVRSSFDIVSVAFGRPVRIGRNTRAPGPILLVAGCNKILPPIIHQSKKSQSIFTDLPLPIPSNSAWVIHDGTRKEALRRRNAVSPPFNPQCADNSLESASVHLPQKTYRLSQTSLDCSKEMRIRRTSEHLGWSDINVSITATQPHSYEIVHRAIPDLWIHLALAPMDLSFVIGQKQMRLVGPPHRISLVPPETLAKVRRHTESDELHTFLKCDVLAEVAGDVLDRHLGDMEIELTLNCDDHSMSCLLLSLKEALFEPAEHSRLKIEYASRALALDVLGKHARQRHGAVGGTEVHQRLTVSQVRLISEYIRENLSADISLNDLAGFAKLSRTLFIQRFKASFRQTPHQYLIAERVQRGRELLTNSSLPVTQIALACGFSDQAHFGMCFKRAMGISPSAYRANLE
ncbi:AraC-like DNA-binding protein [Bradyrhizobium sp. USDA 4524]|uniref:AraC family transcriptional regulator n=1 Tax=unclassified Bradyrhizobium TaxID=2631580 RepID=UPI00209EC96C|nr:MULTISPECIES: AraC family transcriptional regulator [unclassified Bradyrhizobium]MCP1846145.1 AraC-like DNA-binding protein [Bradyrhizobium sp. USDA 4538]MCP1907220.1 AraC-like DNA-binding protein [Bradyrhizobium sp. USDA 4537]MCP1985696.1 AraC-like DNA-binding protein [Bradyrhizobium sp. USDA 4539]